jgi:hypothetical protein
MHGMSLIEIFASLTTHRPRIQGKPGSGKVCDVHWQWNVVGWSSQSQRYVSSDELLHNGPEVDTYALTSDPHSLINGLQSETTSYR